MIRSEFFLEECSRHDVLNYILYNNYNFSLIFTNDVHIILCHFDVIRKLQNGCGG